ncbi:MAG: DNA-binding protein [Bacteroidia bacterium]|nr:DNA-binding protein [Bacteroidia bacterium]
MSSEEIKTLIELARQCPNLSVSINLSDLLEAFRIVLREENEKQVQNNVEESQERLLTEKEVQEMLNVSHSTLFRWNRDKYLCFIKIGNKNRYKYSDIMRIKNNK